MPRIRTALAAILLTGLLAAPAAQARKPVVAYVDLNKHFHLYDAELGREIPAPALTIPQVVRGFGVSPSGRYVLYSDANEAAHLYDRSNGSDTVFSGIQGAPRSVSDTGRVASDMADNGPTRVYDTVAKRQVPTGLDDANGTNGHRQPHISGDGRFVATTCLAGCIKSTVDGDADGFVQDLTTQTDTAFPDDVSGQTKRDEEHPCIDGDGSRVGIDASPAPNDRDVFIYDRTAKQTLVLPGLNVPGKSINYCALDSTGEYVGFADQVTGLAGLYDVAAQALVPLPAGTGGPIWLTRPYTPPVRRLLTRAAAVPARFRAAAGTSVRFTLSRAATVRVTLRRGSRVLRTYLRHARKGASRVTVSGLVRRGGRRVAIAPGRATIRVAARSGRTLERRNLAVRILR